MAFLRLLKSLKEKEKKNEVVLEEEKISKENEVTYQKTYDQIINEYNGYSN